MFTNKLSIELVEQFILACQVSKINLDEIYLFGSNANEKSNENSDIDIAISSSIFSGFTPEDVSLLEPLFTDKKYSNLEPQLFTKKYFEQGDPFIEEIKKTGIKLL